MPGLLKQLQSFLSEPAAARRVAAADRRGLPPVDPGIATAMASGYDWLREAQDRSKTRDGGFARHYSLIDGWASSYPETSGYIIPTLLDGAELDGAADLADRARRCLDWLVAIQLDGGPFQGGKVDELPCVPVTFNTGQILIGLAAGVARLDRARYLEPMRAAAKWLVDTLDDDGCWRKFPTPFAANGEKAYETHVSWGLFEAARVLPDEGFGEAGLRQVAWALTKQQPNGWFASNCLQRPEAPLTHTIGYVLRGVLEAHRWSGERHLLDAACRTIDGLLPAIDADGRLPGRLDADWRGVVDWVCLTGSVQIAHCLLIAGALTGRGDYLAQARKLNAYVRRAMVIDGPAEIRGGVKGSFPADGEYGRYQYLNWACKFMIDSNRAERQAEVAGADRREAAAAG